MLGLILGLPIDLLLAAGGVVAGAYGHKWLAKVTGAPANLTVANAIPTAEAIATAVAALIKKV